MHIKFIPRLVVFLGVFALTGCFTTKNEFAFIIGDPEYVMPSATNKTGNASAMRAMQSHQFLTENHEKLINAAIATLQDLGFILRITSKEHGLLLGSKDRDAVEARNVAAGVGFFILQSLLYGVAGSNINYNESQVINVSLVLSKSTNKSIIVRALFERQVSNNDGVTTFVEIITDPETYRQFFVKLEGAMQLETHGG
jgi:hypothetical protein